MSLAIGLFASVVLILLVYNKPFRQVFGKIALAVGVLLGVGGIIYGCYIAWDFHKQHLAQALADKAQADQWKVVSETPVYLDDQGNPKPTAPAVQPPPGYTIDPPVVEIRGGETLKVINPSSTPKGLEGGMVPILYLGHHQTITVVCGNFGEKPLVGATSKNGELACP